MHEVEFYETEHGRVPFMDFKNELKKQHNWRDLLNKVKEYIDELKNTWPNITIYTDKVTDMKMGTKHPLYELRPKRIRLFFLFYEEKIVILGGYYKKSGKTPGVVKERMKGYYNDFIKQEEKI